MDIQERRGEFVENKIASIVIDKWFLPEQLAYYKTNVTIQVEAYESQAEDRQCGNGVSQGANAEDIQVHGSNAEVPNEITNSHGLKQSWRSRISPNATFSIHGTAFLIYPLDPQSESIDEDALDHRNDMSIPVESFIAGKLGVVLWGDKSGKNWRQRIENNRIE